MRDWPTVSLRTRLFEFGVIGIAVLQGTIAILTSNVGLAGTIGRSLGVIVLGLSVAMIAWAVTQLRGELAVPRIAGAAVVIGAAMRVVGLLPLSYQTEPTSKGLLGTAHLMLIGLGYACVIAGLGTVAWIVSRRVSGKTPLVFSVGAALSVGIMFIVATYAPLPGMPTVLTARDWLGLSLLACDISVLGLSSYIALSYLQQASGVMSRPWLWISIGGLVLAMGDAVQPLLSVYDTTVFPPIMWGLGYALGAVGASLMIDTLQWHEESDIEDAEQAAA